MLPYKMVVWEKEVLQLTCYVTIMMYLFIKKETKNKIKNKIKKNG